MQTRSQGVLGAARRVAAAFFNRITKPQRIDSVIVPFGSTMLGVKIRSQQEVLKLAAVWRCVNLISSSIAMLPWHVFKLDEDGNSTRLVGNDVDWLLHTQPSEDSGAFHFRQTIFAHVLIDGNGYAEIERDNRNRPIALWLIDPERVEPFRTQKGKIAYEVLQDDGGKVIIPAADMFHLHGLSWDGLRGYSVLEVAAGSMSTAMAQDQFLGGFFAQGMRPAGFIKSKGKMGLDALKVVVESLKENHSGVRKFWKPIPLDAELEWQPMTMNMDDAQFIDLRKFTVLDICRWFGVPPHKVMDLDRATFSNIEHQGTEFVTDALLPRIVPAEQEANIKLLTKSRGGLFSKMNVNALMRGDMKARAEFYQIMRNIGVYTPNMILRKEDENTFGPKGDVRVMQSQYVPLDQLGKVPVVKPPPEPEPKPAE